MTPTRTKYRELADAEEAKLEAEAEPDAEPEPEPEPDADEDEDADEEEAEPEAVAEPLSMEAMQALLEAEATRHAEAVEQAFGEQFAAMEECPLCYMLGFVAPESPVLDQTTQRCDRCRGYGVLITESVVPEHINRQCPDCMGNGYGPRVEPVQVAPNFQPAQTNGPTAPAPIPPMPMYDPTSNVWRDQLGNALVSATP